MSNFKSMVFKLDPEQREEQGKLVERYLTALGYEDNVEWNKKRRHDNTRQYIYADSFKFRFMYMNDNCGSGTFETVPTPYQVEVAEHMATAPKELAEYVRGRLVESHNWRENESPINYCGFNWDESLEDVPFWIFVYGKQWERAMATDFWKKHTAPSEAPSEAPTERPKGVIGQWYTLLTDFNGVSDTDDRKAGYTWKCNSIDKDNEPQIDKVPIGYLESYRLATPEEIARAKGEHPQPSKPSKEAREFWERGFLSFSQDHNLSVTDCLEMADLAMAEWQKRFEQ